MFDWELGGGNMELNTRLSALEKRMEEMENNAVKVGDTVETEQHVYENVYEYRKLVIRNVNKQEEK